MTFEGPPPTIGLTWSTPVVTETEGPQAIDQRGRAVALARLGLKVFKLDPYTHRPIAPRFWEQASDDPAKVYRMWTAHDDSSEAHDPGVLTGDGYVVVDVDVKGGKPGEASLFVLEQCGDLDTETLTASTPSGGKHLFYRVPAGLWWTNRQGKKALKPGIDLKGTHGYVVGVGATRPDGSRYDWLDVRPMLDLPKELQDEIGRPLEATPDRQAFQLAIRTPDDEWAYEAAAAYLATAPEAIDHSGTGHFTIIEVANRCMDFGLTPDGVVDVMLEHWVPRCSLDADTVESLPYQVHTLRGSRQQPIGVSHPLGRTRVLDAFERIQLRRREDEGPKVINDSEWPRPSLLLPYDPGDVPPRRFIVPKFIARQFVTGFVSPGGTGKTSFLAAMMLAVGTGDGTAIGQEVIDRTRVWYWNQEDNLDELKRRLGAVIIRHGLAWADMRDRLYLDSGADKPLFIATRSATGLKATAQVEKVIKHIREQEIGLFMIDPLVEFHEGEENDNPQMRLVWATARRIAVEADCAVLVATHSRKPPQASSDGFAGDQDSFRGASSQTGVMRLGFTMFGMSERDAKHYGVHERDRHLYVRVDDAKSNLTLKGPDPLWLKRISVNTGREEVGVLEPVELNRQSGRADLLGLLASVASIEFESLGGVFDRLDDEDRARFGETSHLSRTLKKALNDAGAVVDEKGTWTALTDTGKVEIAFKVGKTGSLIKCVAN